jgi:hypothetical protein
METLGINDRNKASYQINGESVAEILRRTRIGEAIVDPFCVIPGSNIRPIQLASVDRLKVSILEKGFLSTSTIIVNEIDTTDGVKKYRCIEGLHRIEALKSIISTFEQTKQSLLADPFRRVNVHIHQLVKPEVELLIAMALNDEKDVIAKQSFFTRVFFLKRRVDIMSDEDRSSVTQVEDGRREGKKYCQFAFKIQRLYQNQRKQRSF